MKSLIIAYTLVKSEPQKLLNVTAQKLKINVIIISLLVVSPYIIPLLHGKYFAEGDSGLWFLNPFGFLKQSLFSWESTANFGYDAQSASPYIYWQLLIILFNIISFGNVALTFFIYKSFILLIGYWGFYKLIMQWQSSSVFAMIVSFCFIYSIIPFTQMHLYSLFSELVYYTLPLTTLVLYRYFQTPFSLKRFLWTLLVLSFDLSYLPNINFTLGFITPYIALLIFLIKREKFNLKDKLKQIGKLLFYLFLINLWILYAYSNGFLYRLESAVDIVKPIQNFLIANGYATPYVGITGSNPLDLRRAGVSQFSFIFWLAAIQVIALIFGSVYIISLSKRQIKNVTLSLFIIFLIAVLWSVGSTFSLWGLLKSLTDTENIIVSLFRGPDGKIGPTVFISLILLISFLPISNKKWWLLTFLILISPISIIGLMLLANTQTFSQPSLYVSTQGFAPDPQATGNISIKDAYFDLQKFLNQFVSGQTGILRLPLLTFDIVQVATDEGDYIGSEFVRFLYKNPFIYSVNYVQPTDSFVKNTYGALLSHNYEKSFDTLLEHNVQYVLVDQNIRVNKFIADKDEYANSLNNIVNELNTKSNKVFTSDDGSLILYKIGPTYKPLPVSTGQCLAAGYSPKWHLFEWNLDYLVHNFWLKPYNEDGFACFETSSIPGYVYFDDIIKVVLVCFSSLSLIVLFFVKIRKNSKKSLRGI